MAQTAATKKADTTDEQVAAATELVTSFQNDGYYKYIGALDLAVKPSQIDGLVVVHYLESRAGFDTVSDQMLPQVKMTENLVTDLYISLRASAALIALFNEDISEKGEEEEYEIDIPDGVEIIAGTHPDQMVIKLAEASISVIGEVSTEIRSSPQYQKLTTANAKNAEKLDAYVDSLARLLDKINADSPAIDITSMAEDDMMSSPVGKASLREAESVEARRATERREEQRETYRGRLQQLEDTLFGKRRSTRRRITAVSHPQYEKAMGDAFANAVSGSFGSFDFNM